ncbi:MAG: sulfate ABC transporter permease subunit CysT [Candidatus Omnitrophota bacterium]
MTTGKRPFLQRTILPGFGLTLGFSVFYLSLIVLLPLSTLFFKSASLGPEAFWKLVTASRSIAAFRLSFGASFLAALINTFFGFVLAWVMVRYSFPGKKLLDASVDIPFALPTAVAGIALTGLYAPNGWLGKPLALFGMKAAYAPMGIVMALTFISLPFMVRTLEPVIQELDRELEDAAASLGANRWQIFSRVILPVFMPAILTGFVLSFARALGEYGSIVFISGNMPFKTEIVPLLIVTRLEQYDYAGATAIACVMLLASFILLFLTNLLQAWSRRMQGMAS